MHLLQSSAHTRRIKPMWVIHFAKRPVESGGRTVKCHIRRCAIDTGAHFLRVSSPSGPSGPSCCCARTLRCVRSAAQRACRQSNCAPDYCRCYISVGSIPETSVFEAFAQLLLLSVTGWRTRWRSRAEDCALLLLQASMMYWPTPLTHLLPYPLLTPPSPYLPLHLHLAGPRHPDPASRRWRSIFFFIFILLLLVHRQPFTLSTQRRKGWKFLDRYHNSLF